MKTLKKVLSLVLVVAMIASMLIVGAAAAEETNYPEAVAVVTNLGIIEGDGTSYDFAGNVTREQAAKIIAYMLLGKDTAEALKTTAAPFADVAATRWSAGYIAYLKNQGIISGVSDTEFDPTAPVTGVALAKMLLTAVGYGKNGEFEGAAWDINTITLANQKGLYAGTKAADLTKAATREECMLYAYNTLTNIPTVNYNKTFESYYTGTSALDTITGTAALAYTLGRLNYGLVKTGTGVDAYGRPAAVWTVAGVPVVEATATEIPVATFNGKVFYSQLYAALGKAVVAGIDKTAGVSEYYVDGDDSNAYPAVALTSANDNTNFVGAQGSVTELYVTYIGEGKYDVDIVVINEYYATVSRVNTVAGTLTLSDRTTVDGDIADIAGIKKGDHVLYTAGALGVDSIEVITPVTGTYTANQNIYGTQYVIVDGAYYALRTGIALPAYYNYLYDLYLDNQGNVVYVELSPEAEITNFDYIYVTDAAVEIITGNLLYNESTKVVMEVVYADGGKAVVDTEIYTYPNSYADKFISVDGQYVWLTINGVAQDAAAVKAAITTGWHTYTTTEDGSVILGDIAAAANYAEVVPNATVAYNNSTVTVNGVAYGKVANGATVLTTIDALGTATVKTGVASFAYPSATYNSSDVLITYAKGSKTIESITVINVPAAPASEVVVYCVSQGTTGYYGTNYTVAYADGTVAEILVETAMSAGGVYTIIDADADTAYEATPVNAGVVNAYAIYGGTDQAGVWGYDADAIIDVVADSYFVTVQLDANGDGVYTDGLDGAGNTYFFDAYTKVVDCTGNGATSIASGDLFVAYTATAAQSAYSSFYGNPNYCAIIYIVG